MAASGQRNIASVAAYIWSECLDRQAQWWRAAGAHNMGGAPEPNTHRTANTVVTRSDLDVVWAVALPDAAVFYHIVHDDGDAGAHGSCPGLGQAVWGGEASRFVSQGTVRQNNDCSFKPTWAPGVTCREVSDRRHGVHCECCARRAWLAQLPAHTRRFEGATTL